MTEMAALSFTTAHPLTYEDVKETLRPYCVGSLKYHVDLSGEHPSFTVKATVRSAEASDALTAIKRLVPKP